MHHWITAANGISLSVTQIVLLLTAVGGIGTAVATVIKIRPDISTAAITQSQGAIEVMAKLNEDLERERDHWRGRALAAEEDAEKCRREVNALKERIDRRQADRRSPRTP